MGFVATAEVRSLCTIVFGFFFMGPFVSEKIVYLFLTCTIWLQAQIFEGKEPDQFFWVTQRLIVLKVVF